MKAFFEKLSILSLSFMLVSTFAVSPALPAMVDFFANQGISGTQVEFLITVTSLAIMGSLLVNPIISRFLPERAMISLGLVLLTVGGVLPLVTSSYWLIFLGRLVLGFGLGLINAKAITIISSHYEGQERLKLLGWRGSAEVLGSASLTAVVGLLLPHGWSAAFGIYFLALVILGLYLAFVPKGKADADQVGGPVKAKLPASQWRQAIFLSLIAGFVIHVNSLLTLKVPTMVEQAQLGSAQDASLILSVMMLMGILAGLLFRWLITRLVNRLLPLSVMIFSASIALAALGQNLFTLSFGAILSGFFYSIVLTVVFNKTSEDTAPALLHKKMTLVLVGCNIGGASSSLLPALLEEFLPVEGGVLMTYATLGLVFGLFLFVRGFKPSIRPVK